MLGNVLSVENTNLNGSWGVNLTFPGWGHIINGVIAIIIWETFIERLGEGLSSIKWIVKWWSGGGLWDSLDHHGDGDVIVVGEILGFVSILLEDGVEGVVTNNLSERFKSDGFDVIKAIGWGNFKVDCLNFIDWYHNFLGELIWETFIERLGEGLSSIKWIVKWWSGGGLWDSLDHHGDGDVIVVGEILGFVSILLEDGVEGVVTNNLSERFKSDGFDVIKAIGWGNFKVDCLNFIDWYHNFLGELVEIVLGLSFGVNENSGFWGWVSGGLGDIGFGASLGLDESNTSVLLLTSFLVVMFVLK